MIESVIKGPPTAGLRAHLLEANEYAALSQEHHVLAAIGFNPTHLPQVSWPQAGIAMPKVAGQGLFEVWCSSGPVTYYQDAHIQLAMDDNTLAGVLTCDASDDILEQNTFDLYQRIFQACKQYEYPTLFRMWNYLPRINEHDHGGLERYRSFCKGRATAFFDQGFPDSFLPAGTGVGCQSKQLTVMFMAGKEDCRINIENPRQMPAYEYPIQYGPKSPSFARATFYENSKEQLLFVSGTSSILGHESVFAGNFQKQCETSLENIAHLIEADNLKGYDIEKDAGLKDLSFVKVYLRHPNDLENAQAQCKAAFEAHTPIIYLHADICRNDLMVEIEGHVRFDNKECGAD